MSGSFSFTDVTSYAASTPFTVAQVVNIFRYCGYPAYTHFGWVFEADFATLLLRLQWMAPAEAEVVTSNYLAVLPGLESAIDTASANLDTDQAAVWKHNRDEVAHRTALYNQKRRQLCAFVGVSPGAGLRQAGSIVRG